MDKKNSVWESKEVKKRTPDNSEPATGTTLGRGITVPRKKEEGGGERKKRIITWRRKH